MGLSKTLGQFIIKRFTRFTGWSPVSSTEVRRTTDHMCHFYRVVDQKKRSRETDT